MAAAQMASDPAASLPAQTQTWKDTKAVYRLLDEPDVTFDALMQPHWQQTRQRMESLPLVLLVQDTHRPGFLASSQDERLGRDRRWKRAWGVPANRPGRRTGSREVLGCAYQHPFIRIPAPKGETRTQRRQRRKETDIWQECVQAHWSLHCVERARACRRSRGRYLRVPAHLSEPARRTLWCVQIRTGECKPQRKASNISLSRSRGVPAQDQRPFDLPASHGRKARATTLHLSWMPLSLLPPRHDPRLNKLPPLPVWVVRVWEEDTPEGEEPLEWILLTSIEVTCCQDAWQRVDWYRARWVVEEYHQCLKTGCRIEERQVQSAERLIRLLGLLSPLAVRLLQVRDLSRTAPDRRAQESDRARHAGGSGCPAGLVSRRPP